MAATEFELLQEQSRSDWVPLRTLVVLRWFAIAGQTAALFCAVQFFKLQFEVGLAAITIGTSVLANLFSTFLYPENKRLSGHEALLMLVFDILQLGLLLYLTGGLHNPFALMMVAPVTIAATALRLRSTILLGLLAIAIITILSVAFMPLRSASGFPLVLPDLFRFGFWLALVIGIAFIGMYTRQVTREMQSMGEALVATQLALSRAQKLTDLGGVVAAAAHELGTPLATIKLVSSELMDELDDDPELLEDAKLIRDQADRCRDILRSMGRVGKEDHHLKQAPLETVIREAGEPHETRGKPVEYLISAFDKDEFKQPAIQRRPEIIHGLRNLIQNAVDFADTAVRVEAHWDADRLVVKISDDGKGFPASLIGRIGDPFVRRRRSNEDKARRPGYEGMGLGLFIAKTLLERTGAKLTFSNGGAWSETNHLKGALVQVEWPLASIMPAQLSPGSGLGENSPIEG